MSPGRNFPLRVSFLRVCPRGGTCNHYPPPVGRQSIFVPILERLIKAETFLPLLVAALMALGIIACKKEEPNGPQYTLSTVFLENTRSDFRLGTRWVYRDTLTGGRISLTLNKIDSLVLSAGPGYAGYMFYEFGFRLRTDGSIIPLPDDSIARDTFIVDSLTGRDSIVIDTIRQDTVIGRSWRVLPYESVLAGNVLGQPEQAIFFHDSTMTDGKVKQGLRYLGVRTMQVDTGGAGQPKASVNAQSYASDGIPIDSLSATELYWAPRMGLVRFRTRSGRVFKLDSLKR